MNKKDSEGTILVLAGSKDIEKIELEGINEIMEKIAENFPPKWGLRWYVIDEKEINELEAKLDEDC